MGKVLDQKDLGPVIEDLKKQGKKIVTTNGIFDLLHIGHAKFLEMTKKFGDILVVGVNSDSSTKQLKGQSRPIIGEEHRAELIAALGVVDYVAIFSETDPRNFLEVVKPHLHIKGDDYDVEKMVETPVVRKHGGEVKTIACRIGSTSQIIKNLEDHYNTPQ